TAVTVTATDASGNTRTTTLNVIVVDTTPPAFVAPSDLVVRATGPGGAAVTLPAIAATDLVDPTPSVVTDHDSGTFAPGTTAVTVTATDASGNTRIATFNVIVVDGAGAASVVPAITGVSASRQESGAITVTGR